MLIKFSGLMMVLFSLIMVLMTSNAAQAQESATTKTFVVVGTAAMQGGNVSAAREKAISDSLVTAVALMTEELLAVESLVDNFPQLNELLFDQTSTFIQGYKVLTEAGQDKSYRVIVQATVSGKKNIKKVDRCGNFAGYNITAQRFIPHCRTEIGAGIPPVLVEPVGIKF
jgi:hypothetical protein